jgi:hypothetical protein
VTTDFYLCLTRQPPPLAISVEEKSVEQCLNIVLIEIFAGDIALAACVVVEWHT